MDNLHLKVESTGNELIIREGKALEPREDNRIQLSGDITSISNFIRKRKEGYSHQAIDPNRTVVEVDMKAMTILLSLDPQNPLGTTVKGCLDLSDEVKVWGINTNRTYTREELIKLIKFNKLHFDSVEKQAELLKAYLAFNASTNSKLEQESDSRGNKVANFNKKVDTNMPTEFILNIPIFKGFDEERFRVEICLDVTDGGARFWFESTELHEMIEGKKEIIDQELELCDDFVIIYK